jgi:hypothetical protein
MIKQKSAFIVSKKQQPPALEVEGQMCNAFRSKIRCPQGGHQWGMLSRYYSLACVLLPTMGGR